MALTAALALLTVAGGAAHAAPAASFAPEIQIQGKTLELNGAAKQRVLLFDLYDVGLYLEEPTRNPTEAIGSDQVKRIELRALRNLPRSKVASALRSGIERSVGKDGFKELEPRVNAMLEKVRDVRDRDRLALTYVPGRGTVMQEGNQTRAVIGGKDFADALFAIWLGDSTDAPKVRKQLLGL
jgi:hypothetical protein